MPHTRAALILMMAFTLPGAAEALGLGEIHVVSALNEPLVAEVDIVGATTEDLTGIRASIANPETFQRFGVDRPAFLSSTEFRIVTNGKGQPVLAIRSTEAFTEPLINMLIDLRGHSGEVIRQYSLLLDPAGFPSDTRRAESAPTDSAPGSHTAPAAPQLVAQTSQRPLQSTPIPARTSPAVGGPVPPDTVRVAAGATLRGIASRVSSRRDAGLERTMIAIYHENPKAFEGNINRLRLGAVLTIPSSPEVSKISVADANHEVRVQMETWRAALKLVTPTKPVEPAVAASAPVPHESAIPTESAAGRQESISNAPQAALHAPGNTAETSDDSALDRRIQILEQGLNELQGALAREQATLAAIQTRVALADDTRAVTAVPATAKSGRGFGASSAAILVLASGAWGALYLWRGRRRLNPLISAADAVDVLNGAVKREPNRRDLRMKLLETYYAAAATSRQGFLQLAQSLAGEREHMSDGEWNKIAGMGRQIAADNDLFTPGTAQPDNKHLATYA